MTASLAVPLQGGYLEGSINPFWTTLAVLAFAAAAIGTHAAAALLVYSPTKLTRRLKNGRRDAVCEELDAHHTELQVVARATAVLGLIGGVLLLIAAAQGGLQTPVMILAIVASVVVLGVLPSLLAEHRAEGVVLATLPILRALRLVFRWPVVRPLVALSSWVLRVFKVADSAPKDAEQIADEILAAVSDSAEENDLEDEEKAMLGNVVELKDLTVSEVMTPRPDIVALAADMPLRDALRKANETGHSRYPVYEGTVDDVVGVFYVKDVLGLLDDAALLRDGRTVAETMRKPQFVPESMAVVELLREVRRTKVQMAVVLDEYGGTAGLVSLEDILEEIVGEIEDEYDPEVEAPLKIIERGRVVEVAGRLRVDEVSEHLGVELPESEEYDTIGGFIFNHLGRIPEVGETFEAEGVAFDVLEVHGRRVMRVRLTVLEPQPTEATGDGGE